MSEETETSKRGLPRTVAATGVALIMLFFALSIWTLIPLGWVWVGSQLAATQFPSIGPYILVLLGIVVTILGTAWVIGRLNDIYVSLTGSHTVAPLRAAWLRSVRDNPHEYGQPRLVEVILILSAILALAAFIFWFLLYAGSPIGNA